MQNTLFLLCLVSITNASLVQRHDARVALHSDKATNPYASVYGHVGTFPDGPMQSVELLRFVTAYRTGLEAIVDITPYAPLLRAAAEAHGNVTFYAFIDTWVGNETGGVAMYWHNDTGECSNVTTGSGNGWSMNLEIVYSPPVEVDTRPRAAITVSSGPFGGSFNIGAVQVTRANLTEDGSKVLLDKPLDFANVVDASVYDCAEGTSSMMEGAFFGAAAQKARSLLMRPRSDKVNKGDENEEKAIKEWYDDMVETLARPDFFTPEVTGFNTTDNIVFAKYKANRSDLEISVGLPVFFSGSVFTEQLFADGESKPLVFNMSAPFKPIGEVLEVSDGTFLFRINTPCWPRGSDLQLPGFLIPRSKHILPSAESLTQIVLAAARFSAQELMKDKHSGKTLASPWLSGVTGASGEIYRTVFGVDSAGTKLAEQERSNGPPLFFHIEDTGNTNNSNGISTRKLVPMQAIGRLDLKQSTANGYSFLIEPQTRRTRGSNADESSEVCVVTQRTTGHVMSRDFDIPSLSHTDRVVAQLAITGHGWASTTEQCGEYCHAVYSLKLNGESAADVTQFRSDCKDNPIGEDKQFGTWWESRNGWCPGTVEPGLYLDVTKFVKDGGNVVSLDVSVWNSAKEEYEPYTDYAGFVENDIASLVVGLSFFVYDEEAVKAVHGQSKAFTAAEIALREGVSVPEALHIPRKVYQKPNIVLLEEPSSKSPPKSQKKFLAPQRYDVEEHAPWYLFNSSEEKDPAITLMGAGNDGQSIDVFADNLIQINTRTIQSSVPLDKLPINFGTATMHLRLTDPPPPLQIDHWDRLASIGIVLPATETENLVLRPSPDPLLKQEFQFQRPHGEAGRLLAREAKRLNLVAITG